MAHYVVFKDGQIIHMGTDPIIATDILRAIDGSAHSKYLDVPKNLDDLVDTYTRANLAISKAEDLKAQAAVKPTELVDLVLDAVDSVIDSIDDAGINIENVEKCAHAVKDAGEKLYKDVRLVGFKAMKSVGEKLVALGNTLQVEPVKTKKKCMQFGSLDIEEMTSVTDEEFLDELQGLEDRD